MIKILFICHGNICRSPMAEFVMKDILAKRGISDQYFIASVATSMEEIGNPVHPGTRRILKQHGIACDGKVAVHFEVRDYQAYDFIIGMEQYNIKNIMRLIGTDSQNKVSRLLDFTKSPGDIADPWYTGDFEATYKDVCNGCNGLLEFLFHRK